MCNTKHNVGNKPEFQNQPSIVNSIDRLKSNQISSMWIELALTRRAYFLSGLHATVNFKVMKVKGIHSDFY